MCRTTMRAARALGLVLLFAAATTRADGGVTSDPVRWPDTFLARIELLALLQSLNAELLSHDSATVTLERWCDRRGLAESARVVVERIRGEDPPPSEDLRRELAVTPADVIRHRRVRLRCGTTILSEADNWYVPARLTDAMNAELDGTDAPFGKVVRALRFARHTLSADLLWSPLPEGWESRPPPADGGGDGIRVPADLLRHRALLTLADGIPFSEVIETYKASVLGAPPRVAQEDAPPAERLIEHYDMHKVPEEGIWFALAYRSRDRLSGTSLPERYRGRPHAAGNAIIGLATSRDFSALHRLRTDETWHFYGGSPLELLMLYPDGRGRRVTLGPGVLSGQSAQVTVPHGVWMGAAPIDASPSAYSLFGTQLSPAFDYADFEPGQRDVLQRRYPGFAADIARLTRVPAQP